jgi:hypothetical protein
MKPLYDAMFYVAQPSLIRRGLRPLFMLDDGVLNRSTVPEADNGVGTPGASFAFRRAARDAIAAEKGIWQHQYKLPKSYDAVPQPVCLDFEDSALMGKLYTENVEDDERELAALQLSMCVREMKREAAYYGKPLSVGAYAPLLPFANGPAAKAAAEADWKPYLDELDVAYVGCYFRSDSLDAWEAQVTEATAACRRVLPHARIVPLTVPHYGHEAPESIRYTPAPMGFYRKSMALLFARPEVDGVGMWGGVKFRDNPDQTQRLPWLEVEKYLSAATAAGRSANNPTR